MDNPPTRTPDTLPTGTVTFLFTDIEGSTQLWERYPDQTRTALTRHDQIIQELVAQYAGVVVRPRGEGDSRFAVFSRATDAVAAAAHIQRTLFAERWPKPTPLLVRIALHTGEADLREGDYYGTAVNRCARLRSAAHGGQTLLSQVTHGLVRDALPPDVTLFDLGEHRLKDLTRPEHIFQLAVPDLPSQFQPLNTLDTHPNNFPLQPTPLVGREKELAEVQKMLGRGEVRLVTLTGPGGTGKTRLGLQVASEVLDNYKDGAWFVDLSPLTDSRLVVSTTTSVLGVKEAGGTPLSDTLKQYLKDKSILLVLDNFEQVVGAAKEVSAMIAACPNLKVLATSRIPLHIRGEKEYPVPPLSTPDVRNLPPLERLSQYEAVRLFIERATDVKPDFQVTNENASAVAEICARLDGLPLAIELAAARIRLFPPQALLTRLSSRLKLLTGGAKDLPARQQTLRNTIEWSYDLLSAGEKQLFRRIAVFQGGRTLEALEAVCNSEALQVEGQLQVDVLEGVEGLVSQSLLQQREGKDGRNGGGGSGEPRFWMLETIHEYASEKLQESGEGEEINRQHALYFMRLAEEAEGELRGERQTEWLGRLEDEHDNIRAALQWAKETSERGESGKTIDRETGVVEALEDVDEAEEIGLRTAGAIWRFWYWRGYFSEGREQLAGFLKKLEQAEEVEEKEEETLQGVGPDLRAELGVYNAKALIGAGVLASYQGDYASARSLYEESLAIRRELGDKGGIAYSLLSLGNVAAEQSDYASARPLHEESLSVFRELGDKWGIALSLNNLGNMAHLQGDQVTARSLHEESLSVFKELGDKGDVAMSLGNLGLVALARGDYASARSLYEESLAITRELGDKGGIAASLVGLAGLTVRKAFAVSTEGAGSRARAGSGMATKGEHREHGEHGEEGKQGLMERGAKLLGAAEALLQSIRAVLGPGDRQIYERAIALAREELGEEGLEAARQEGRAMSLEQAIEYALEPGN